MYVYILYLSLICSSFCSLFFVLLLAYIPKDGLVLVFYIGLIADVARSFCYNGNGQCNQADYSQPAFHCHCHLSILPRSFSNIHKFYARCERRVVRRDIWMYSGVFLTLVGWPKTKCQTSVRNRQSQRETR